MVDSPQDNNGDFNSIEAELDAYKREHARLLKRIRELYEENRAFRATADPGPGNSPKVQAAALEVLTELREMPPEEFRKALDEQMALQMTDNEVRASISSHYKRDPDCTVKGDMWDAAFHDGIQFGRAESRSGEQK